MRFSMRKLYLTILVMFVFSAALFAASDTASLVIVGTVPPKVSLSITELNNSRSLSSSTGNVELLVVENSNSTLPYAVSISTAQTIDGKIEFFDPHPHPDPDSDSDSETASGSVSVLHNGYLLDIPAGAAAVWSSGAYGTASNRFGMANNAAETAPEYIVFTVTAL